MSNNPTCSLGDKEIVSDLLATQKHITSVYNVNAGECQNLTLRDTFLNILNEEHTIQSELFEVSHSHGWYPTKEAPAADINEVRMQVTQ